MRIKRIEFLSVWIDLDHVLSISSPFITTGRFNSSHPAVAFDVQMAFIDLPVRYTLEGQDNVHHRIIDHSTESAKLGGYYQDCYVDADTLKDVWLQRSLYDGTKEMSERFKLFVDTERNVNGLVSLWKSDLKGDNIYTGSHDG